MTVAYGILGALILLWVGLVIFNRRLAKKAREDKAKSAQFFSECRDVLDKAKELLTDVSKASEVNKRLNTEATQQWIEVQKLLDVIQDEGAKYLAEKAKEDSEKEPQSEAPQPDNTSATRA